MQFENVQLFILLVVTFLVTNGIKSLSTMLGKDLSGSSAALVAAVVGFVLSLFNSVIVPIIPPDALPFVEPAAQILVMILGAFGLHKTVKSLQPVV